MSLLRGFLEGFGIHELFTWFFDCSVAIVGPSRYSPGFRWLYSGFHLGFMSFLRGFLEGFDGSIVGFSGLSISETKDFTANTADFSNFSSRDLHGLSAFSATSTIISNSLQLTLYNCSISTIFFTVIPAYYITLYRTIVSY